MRVALLVPAPFDTISGGYGYDRAMVAELRAAGHEVAVMELAGRHPLPDDAAYAAAAAAWARVANDAVPVIDGLALPAFAPLADALAARRTIGLIHHPTALETGHDNATRDALRVAEQDLMPKLARTIVTSPGTGRTVLDDFGVLAERLSVVVPGTEPAPRSVGSGGPGCAILAIGTLSPRKGHDVLLGALAMLPDLDWTLTLVGGPLDSELGHGLMAMAEQLGIASRVTFAGAQVGEALAAQWRHADLFALATHYEGYGMVIAEALKRGVAVAITDGGAAGALVTPETGIVAPVGDRGALARAMRRLIYDTALRTEMREAAWHAGQALPDWRRQAREFAAALAA
jgi:glycosyltransferase involved in cell wall biosynthesis